MGSGSLITACQCQIQSSSTDGGRDLLSVIGHHKHKLPRPQRGLHSLWMIHQITPRGLEHRRRRRDHQHTKKWPFSCGLFWGSFSVYALAIDLSTRKKKQSIARRCLRPRMTKSMNYEKVTNLVNPAKVCVVFVVSSCNTLTTIQILLDSRTSRERAPRCKCMLMCILIRIACFGPQRDFDEIFGKN